MSAMMGFPMEPCPSDTAGACSAIALLQDLPHRPVTAYQADLVWDRADPVLLREVDEMDHGHFPLLSILKPVWHRRLAGGFSGFRMHS